MELETKYCGGLIAQLDIGASNKIEVGTAITLKGKLLQPKAATNPGQFDQRRYYSTLGYPYYFKEPEIVSITPCRNFLLNGIIFLRKKLKKVYSDCCDASDAGIFEAICLGDKSDMDPEIKSLFMAGGIGHVLAISGLHISMMGMGVFNFIRKRLISYPVSAFVSGAFVVFYGILTGNAVSATRAIIMFICAVIAKVLGRAYDILSAVSLAGIIILISNPFLIGNAGFLLSFSAILGISVIREGFNFEGVFSSKPRDLTSSGTKVSGRSERSDKVEKADKAEDKLFIRIAKPVFNAVLSSLSISLATLPVTLWFYYEVPVYSLFLNLFVIPLMSIVMSSAILTGIIGMVNVVLGRFMAGVAHYIIILFSYACLTTGKLKNSAFVGGKPLWWQVAGYVALIIVFCSWDRIVNKISEKHVVNKRKEGVARKIGHGIKANQYCGRPVRHCETAIICFGKAAVLFLALFLLLSKDMRRGVLEVTFLDVGQGDAVFVQNKEGKVAFIDGGSSTNNRVYVDVIEPFLKYKGVNKIQYLFITHGDKDHYSAWSQAMESEDEYVPVIKTLVVNHSIIPEEPGGYNKGEHGETEHADDEYADDKYADDKYVDDKYMLLIRKMREKGTDIFVDKKDVIYGMGNYYFISLNEVNSKAYSSLTAGSDMEDDNDSSLVLLLTNGKENSFDALFTGDISSLREAVIVDNLRKMPSVSNGVDVLKVAHHGSKYSTGEEWLEVVCPGYSVISCSAKNRYGHPHEEVLKRLDEMGSIVYRTDENGAIRIYFNNAGIVRFERGTE